MRNPKKKFSKIYDQYIDKIYRFIFLKVNSQNIAQDLCSETFLRGWEAFKNQKGAYGSSATAKIKNQKKIENPQAFLYQIARNLIIDHYREKGRTQFVSADCVPIEDPGPSMEEESFLNSDIDKIRIVLADLKQDYQEVIVWRYINDLSISEIAKMLNKPKGTVRVTLHRALKALKERFGETYKVI